MDEQGRIITGLFEDSDGYEGYSFLNGSQLSGINKFDNTWYLFNENVQEGLYKDQYYVYEDGTLASNEFVDVYGTTFYFNDQATIARDEIIQDGNQTLYFDLEGKQTGKDEFLVSRWTRFVIDQLGNNLYDLFFWTVDHITYSEDITTRTPLEYASLGFQGTGNCLAFASVFYHLAEAAGYTARMINGSTRYKDGHIGPHGWVLIREGDKEYTWDPQLQDELGYITDFYRTDPLRPPVRYYYEEGDEPLGGYIIPE